jgi:hypothetical protein
MQAFSERRLQCEVAKGVRHHAPPQPNSAAMIRANAPCARNHRTG